MNEFVFVKTLIDETWICAKICTLFDGEEIEIVWENFRNEPIYSAPKEERAAEWTRYQSAKIVGMLQYHFLREVKSDTSSARKCEQLGGVRSLITKIAEI